ncbi:hypothetical protein L1987_71268 [Smallanthus sonchifolius]|uniref:Uncharacterized protein n=1 Tax=Smallanthus sonchifolius TaxID=185202 RepID=A0ACB9AWA3_9ASTR|nr:hypothetical protein L1987_71268 [Smallanthus sonchifolius]
MSPWLIIVVVLLLTTLKSGTAESNNTSNMMIRSFCDRVDPMSPSVFFSNLNATYASLRGQLSRDGVYFARAQNLGDADSVYGTVQCREYLSAAQCLACFDVGVSTLARCTSGNGAYVILDDCFLSKISSSNSASSDYVSSNQQTYQTPNLANQANLISIKLVNENYIEWNLKGLFLYNVLLVLYTPYNWDNIDDGHFNRSQGGQIGGSQWYGANENSNSPNSENGWQQGSAQWMAASICSRDERWC